MTTLAISRSPSVFQYDPLPSKSAIRVVSISPGGASLPDFTKELDNFDKEDVIEINLECIDISLPQVFDALSYSWDNPLCVFSSQEEADKAHAKFAAKYPIFCNGKSLLVGANLYEALLALRHTSRSEIAAKASFKGLHPSFEDRPLLRKHIWIDAICINQGDQGERSSQVSMMDQIYKAADAVLIWLGPQDEFARQAFKTIRSLASASLAAAKTFRLSAQLESSQYESLGIDRISPSDWYCLYALLERRWFRRAWIIQEVSLAKTAVVVCGGLWLPWAGIVSAATWLRESQCCYGVWSVIQAEIEGKRGNRLMGDLIPLDPDENRLYQPESPGSASRWSRRNPAVTIYLLADLHMGLGLDDPVVKSHGRPKVMDLLTMLSSFRQSECSEPKDKLYSLLNICMERQMDKSPLHDIPIDYSKTTAEIFTKAASAIIRNMGNLTILSHVLHKDGPRMHGLPSWVPDWYEYSQPLPFITQLWLRSSKYNRSGEYPFVADGSIGGWTPDCWPEENAVTLPNATLRVSGKLIGTVENVAKIDMGDLSLTYDVLNDIPPIYQFYKTVPVTELESPEGLGSSEEVSDDLAHSMFNMTLTEIDANGVPKKQDEEPTPSTFPILVRCEQTRFEALWRTLIADVWEFQHPASRKAGLGFAEYLIGQLSTLDLQAKFFRMALMGKEGAWDDLLHRMFEQLEALKALRRNEELCIEAWKSRNPDSELPSTSASGDDSTSDNLCTKPMQYIPSIDSMSDIEAYKPKQERARELWSVHLRKDRLLISTDECQLGLAPLSTIPGDQVWVLKGSRMPFILRELDNGNFHLIGESYIHGIMHGEAVGLVNGEPLHHHVDTSDIRDVILE